jgi:hypothetical protein
LALIVRSKRQVGRGLRHRNINADGLPPEDEGGGGKETITDSLQASRPGSDSGDLLDRLP